VKGEEVREEDGEAKRPEEGLRRRDIDATKKKTKEHLFSFDLSL
jgi:hypothetical protein